MSRQSKDFKELLNYKKSESDGQTAEDDRSPGVEKISDVLQKFIKPFKNIRNLEDYDNLLAIAVAAWNSTFVSYAERQEFITKLLSKNDLKNHPELQESIKIIFNGLVARKNKYFSNDLRLIESYKVKSIGDNKYHLTVNSSLLDWYSNNFGIVMTKTSWVREYCP